MRFKFANAATLLAAGIVLNNLWSEPAAAQHFDPLISQDAPANGGLVVGAYDDGASMVGDPGPVRVFEFDVEDDGAGNPYFGNGEPGFRARPTAEVAPYYGLPGGADLGFSFKTFSIGANSANLWYWDGSGAPNFVPSVGHQLKLQKGASTASATGANTDVAGFSIATTSTIGPNPGIGTIHQHIDTYLSLGASGEPTNLGIYLVGLEFTLTGGHDPSDLTYFVYATLDEGGSITEEMHEAAAQWVEANLVAQAEAVPEPSSILLGAAGGLGLIALVVRRRSVRRAEM